MSESNMQIVHFACHECNFRWWDDGMDQNGNNFLFSETKKMGIGLKCKDQKFSFTYFK